VFERGLTLVIVLAVLVGGGIVVAKKLKHSHTVSAAEQRLMVLAVAHREPGAAFTSRSCSSGGCTFWVRKGASHTCDGWQAAIGADGKVSLVGVGKKDC
jgi:hypothetical protein